MWYPDENICYPYYYRIRAMILVLGFRYYKIRSQIEIVPEVKKFELTFLRQATA